MISSALHFAAGFGTRMLPLTADRPKPLIDVAGRALLDHALELTDHIPTRVVNAHYKAPQIEAHLKGRDIAVSLEQPDILDTGGGLRQALPLLGAGPVLTLNTDAVWRGPQPIKALEAAWDAARMDALLLCVPLERAIGRQGGGDFGRDVEGRLQRGGTFVYTGAQIIRPEGLRSFPQPAFSLNLLWDRIAGAQRLYGLVWDGQWCDVGHPGGIGLAEEMLGYVSP